MTRSGESLLVTTKTFELLCLESYQSGLSWLTVLNKRQAFNRVFHDYNIERVAQFSLSELEDALQNPDIIRHKLKLEATVNNAKQVLKSKMNLAPCPIIFGISLTESP